MDVVSLLALAVQEQVGVTPAMLGTMMAGCICGLRLGLGVLALVAALLLARCGDRIGYGNARRCGRSRMRFVRARKRF